MKRILFALLFSLFAVAATAQVATTAIKLSLVPPTTNTDGSAIPAGSLTCTIYQGPKAGPFTAIASNIACSTNPTTSTITSTASGDCFAAVANEAEGSSVVSSAPSSTVCVGQPGAPAVSVSITVTLT